MVYDELGLHFFWECAMVSESMQTIAIPVKSVLTVITLIAFVAVGFCLFLGFGMAMNPDGSMGHCPFNPNGSLCAMSVREHLAIWQTMFAALPQKALSISVVLSTLWMIVAAFIFKHLSLKYSKLLLYDYRPYAHRYTYSALVDVVKRAIYQGLINPKIF